MREGFSSALTLCCPSFFSTSFEKQFAYSHRLLDFSTFLQIIQLLLDTAEAATLWLFKAQLSNAPSEIEEGKL